MIILYSKESGQIFLNFFKRNAKPLPMWNVKEYNRAVGRLFIAYRIVFIREAVQAVPATLFPADLTKKCFCFRHALRNSDAERTAAFTAVAAYAGICVCRELTVMCL